MICVAIFAFSFHIAKDEPIVETNLKIALKLQNLLEQTGCTVILTRSD